MRSNKILIGVTGGIGSGKTLVCKFLKQLGCTVYHADEIAKRLYKTRGHDPLLLKKKLTANFGQRILDREKNISLSELRKLVFSNKLNQQRVNCIVHPFVIRDILSKAKRTKNKFIIIEAALIFEANFDEYLDYTILVYSSIKKRIERIKRRDNVLEKDIRKIIKLQMPEKEKLKRADFIIYNDSSVNKVKKDTQTVLKLIKKVEKG